MSQDVFSPAGAGTAFPSDHIYGDSVHANFIKSHDLVENAYFISFCEKLTQTNFDQVKQSVDKTAHFTKFPYNKLKEVLAQIVQFERSYFLLDFISNKKQFAKWQSISHDCVQILCSIEVSITPLGVSSSSETGALHWSPILYSLKTFFNVRRELAIFYENISSITTLEATFDCCISSFDLINGGKLWLSCFALMKECLLVELLVVESILECMKNLSDLQMTCSLICLKKAEKYFLHLCKLRGQNIDLLNSYSSLSSSSGSSFAQPHSGTITASRPFSALWGGSNTKHKNNILTYLSSTLSFLNALFGCCFFNSLKQFSPSPSLFPDLDKVFKIKNWIHSSIVGFSETNKVNCWLIHYNPNQQRKHDDRKDCVIERFLRRDSRMPEHSQVKMVLSTNEEIQPITNHQFIQSISHLLIQNWCDISIGTVFGESVKVRGGSIAVGDRSGDYSGDTGTGSPVTDDSSIKENSLKSLSLSCGVRKHSDVSWHLVSSVSDEVILRLMYCRYEQNFVLFTTLPTTFSLPLPTCSATSNSENTTVATSITSLHSPLPLNKSGNTTSGSTPTSSSSKSRKNAKTDTLFKNNFINLLKKLKGLPTFALPQ